MFFSFMVTTVTGPLGVRVPCLQPSSLRPVQGGSFPIALWLEELWETSWERRGRVGLGGEWFPDLEQGCGALIKHDVSPTFMPEFN